MQSPRSNDVLTAPPAPAPHPLRQLLYRPIIFRQPERVVHPPSWLEHIPFAFWIVDVLRPDVIVELGTQSGDSYAAFAQAVQMTGLAAKTYAIDTWKGDAHAGFYDESVFTEWVAYHDARFSSFSRLIRSTFEEAAAYFGDGGIDLLHLDGCHTYDAARADFEMWRGKMSPRGVVLMHDTNVRERDFGVWQLFAELSREYASFEFLHGHGLGVVAVGSEMPDALRWLLGHASADPGDVRAIRECFAHLGGAIGTRFTAAAIEHQLRHELETRGVAAAETAQRLAEVSIQLETTSAERRDLENAVALKDQVIADLRSIVAERESVLRSLEASVRERTERVEILEGNLASEVEHRQRAEAERDDLSNATRAGQLGTAIQSGIKGLESGPRKRRR